MRPQTLIDCQILLGDPKLTRLLAWTQSDNKVIAKPKRQLRGAVFQELRRRFEDMGGRYQPGVGFTVELL